MNEANHNPLIAPLLALLQQAAGSYKVHELLAALRQQGAIPQFADDEQLQLFRVNFLLMNALYQLQAELYEEGWWLVISTLDIRLEPLAKTEAAAHLGQHQPGVRHMLECALDTAGVKDPCRKRQIRPRTGHKGRSGSGPGTGALLPGRPAEHGLAGVQAHGQPACPTQPTRTTRPDGHT